MSNYLAIATVTATLASCLLPVLQAAVPGVEEVSTRRPDDPRSAEIKPHANIFLYQVTPNAAWRNADLPTRRGDGLLVQRPQAALDLHYLLTFYGSETYLEPQRLLGATVSHLYARPILTRAAIQLAQKMADQGVEPIQPGEETGDPLEEAAHFLVDSDLAGQIELIRFTPLPLNLEELSKLWSIFA